MSCHSGHFGSRVTACKFPPTWLQLLMKYVAPAIGILYLWLAAAFWSGRRDLGGLCCLSWRPGRRSAAFSIAAKDYVHGVCDRHGPYFRAAADRDGGQPIGAGIQSRKEVGLCGEWRCGTGLEGSKSMGRDCRRGCDEGKSYSDFYGKEIEVWPFPRPTRRRGVHMLWGGYEIPLVQPLCGENGGPPLGSGKSHFGTDECVVEAGEDAPVAPLHGLCHMDPVFKKGTEGCKVSNLCDAGGRIVCGEDGGWTSQLPTVVGVVQGDANSFHHAGPPTVECAASMGKSHGTSGQQIPKLLAFAGGGREQGEGRASRKNTGVGKAGYRQRRTSTFWLEPCGTLASGLEEGAGGRRVLARTSTCPSLGMVGSWGTWSTTNPRRRSGEDRFERWPAASPWRSSERRPCRRRWGEDIIVQGTKGGKEEKVEGGKGRVGELEKSTAERIKRWRRRKRRWQAIKLCGGGVLCLEQREWRVWGPPTRGGVQRKEEKTSPLHLLQIAWPSFKGLPWEEVKAVLIMTYTRVMGEGGAASSSRGGKGSEEVQKGNTVRRTRVGSQVDESDDIIEGDRVEINGELKSEREYVEDRIFKFVHHFSGRVDHLSLAILEEATRRNMKVVCVGVDKERDGEDLSSTYPYVNHLASIKKGDVDGFHAGFPCNTYSRLRWRPAPNLPKPIRSRSHPYGLPGNDAKQQAEADLGTVLMCRSIDSCKAMAEANDEYKVAGFYTMENPPPSSFGEEQHISAWEMPEMVKFMESRPEFRKAFFHTCRFQQKVPVGRRIKKPQLFGGNLNGLASLGRMCNCGDARHEEVVGKEKSKKSGEYPQELCEEYAKLALDHFEKMGRAEFWDAKERITKRHLEKLREKAEAFNAETAKVKKRMEETEENPKTPKIKLTPRTPSTPRKRRREEEEEMMEKEETAKAETKTTSFSWTPGEGKHGAVRASQAKASHPKNIAFFGGMRHPAKSVEQLPTVQSLGVRMRAVWEKFVRLHSRVLETAETYTTKEVKVHEDLVDKWREELRRLWGTKPAPSLRLKEQGVYQTPVDFRLLRSWQERAGDPESEVPDWLEFGCPLGIEKEIKTCNIFPPMMDDETKVGGEADMAAELERKGFKNYASMEDKRMQRLKLEGMKREVMFEGSAFKKGGSSIRTAPFRDWAWC